MSHLVEITDHTKVRRIQRRWSALRRLPAEILLGVGDREKTDWQGRKVPEFEGPGFSAKSLGCAEVKHASLSGCSYSRGGSVCVKPYRASHSKDPDARGPSWLFSQMAL